MKLRQIQRKGDMGEGLKLSLLLDDDGDVNISILPEDHRLAEHSIEFCTSGSQSYNTVIALHALFKAMEADEKSRPQNLIQNTNKKLKGN